MLASVPFFLAAGSRDVELEKTSNEQKAQIQSLEASIEQAKAQFKADSKKLQDEISATSEAVSKQESRVRITQSAVDSIYSELNDLKNNPKPRYDEITFANGQSFVGKAVRFHNNLITIQSASGEEKTGPLSIMKHIEFHLSGLSAEEFPEAKKRAVVERKTHAQVMAKFNPNLVFLVVSRGDKNYDDGITRRGNTTYYSSAEEDVQLKVKVGYKNPQAKLEGCSLQVFALGRDLENKKLGEVLIKQDFDLGAIGPEGETVETAAKRIRYQKSKYYYKKSGIDYYSYLAVLKNKDGEIIHMKGSRSSVEAMYEKLKRLSSGDSFTY